MTYEVRAFPAHDTVYVRWEDDVQPTDWFERRYWDVKLVRVYGKPWFDVLASPATPSLAGVDADRSLPRPPSRAARLRHAHEARAYWLRQLEQHHPLLKGKLVVRDDGSLDLRMPGIEQRGLAFVVRLQDAIVRGVDALAAASRRAGRAPR